MYFLTWLQNLFKNQKQVFFFCLVCNVVVTSFKAEEKEDKNTLEGELLTSLFWLPLLLLWKSTEMLSSIEEHSNSSVCITLKRRRPCISPHDWWHTSLLFVFQYAISYAFCKLLWAVSSLLTVYNSNTENAQAWTILGEKWPFVDVPVCLIFPELIMA